MYLKKLEIQGFKSFANKVALEFPQTKQDDKGITAIVGPNGSGKSNTSDAIRWVLGEQSVKSLRGKKTEDLIFSGSGKKARLGFAEVSLHLDNSDHIAPIDYEEIVITRRLYRSGESEYLLNKKQVRLTDIVLLLAKAKFAQKTYSVIGQGMIDSILIAPPTERKEFFDEAAGIKEFQIKRDNSLNKLKNTQKNLQQVDIILQELEPRLRSLTRQVKRLEQREEIEKKLKENQIDYYSSLLSEIDGHINQTRDKKNKISPALQQLEQELKINQQKLDQASQETTRSENFYQLQNELSKLVDQKNSLLREQAVLKGKLDVEYAKSGQLNLVWLNKRDDEVVKRIVEMEISVKQKESNNQWEQNLSFKKDKLQKIELEIDRLKGKIEELRLGGDKLNDDGIKIVLQEIYELQKNFIDRIKQVQSLDELGVLKKEAENIYKKISNFKEKFALSQDVENIAREIEQIQNSLKVFQNEKNSLFADINEIQVNQKIYQEKIILLKQEIDREKNELKKIKTEISQSSVEKGSIEEDFQIKEQNEKIQQQLITIELEIKKSQDKLNDFNTQEEKKKIALIQLQREYSEKQGELHTLTNQINEINISLTRLTTKQENILEDIENELGDKGLIIKDFNKTVNRDLLNNQIQQFKRQLELIGGIDEEAIVEYKQIKERYEFLNEQSTDLKKAIESLEYIIIELDKTIIKEFDLSFNKINKEFDKFFKILFDGGTAKLVKIAENEVVDDSKTEKDLAIKEIEQQNQEIRDKENETDDFVDIQKKFKRNNIYAGIDINAMPPDKKVSHINMLSGGERALTAIALVCAIISCNPSPFVVLDEVDAALDEANSDRFSSILHELSHKTQFIVITHNRSTMHKAKILYGVTMGEDGVSRLLSAKLEDAEKLEEEGLAKMV